MQRHKFHARKTFKDLYFIFRPNGLVNISMTGFVFEVKPRKRSMLSVLCLDSTGSPGYETLKEKAARGHLI